MRPYRPRAGTLRTIWPDRDGYDSWVTRLRAWSGMTGWRSESSSALDAKAPHVEAFVVLGHGSRRRKLPRSQLPAAPWEQRGHGRSHCRGLADPHRSPSRRSSSERSGPRAGADGRTRTQLWSSTACRATGRVSGPPAASDLSGGARLHGYARAGHALKCRQGHCALTSQRDGSGCATRRHSARARLAASASSGGRFGTPDRFSPAPRRPGSLRGCGRVRPRHPSHRPRRRPSRAVLLGRSSASGSHPTPLCRSTTSKCTRQAGARQVLTGCLHLEGRRVPRLHSAGRVPLREGRRRRPT